MNSKKIAVGAATFILALLLVALAAEARPFRGPGLKGLRFLLELKLDPAQQDEMLNIIERYRGAGRNLRAELREAGSNLRNTLQAEPFSEEAVRKAYRGLCALQEERLVARARMMADLKAVLTPEQRLQLEQRKAHWTERSNGRIGSQRKEKSQ